MESGVFRKGLITDKYDLDEVLGKGSFGMVKKLIEKTTKEEYAAKIINKAELDESDVEALQNEIGILLQISHPNVVRFFELWEDDFHLYMVMELMKGGELFQRIIEKDHYSEREAADTIKPIVEAIKYCHAKGIVHRDLKPQNLLFETTDIHSTLKVSDFGLAKLLEQETMQTFCGSPSYIAPEVIAGKAYNNKVDCWSLGIILYIMLCGYPPFESEDVGQLFDQISKGNFEFSSPAWDDISSLVVNPEERLSAEEILHHKWITGDLTPRKDLKHLTLKIQEFSQKEKVTKQKRILIEKKSNTARSSPDKSERVWKPGQMRSKIFKYESTDQEFICDLKHF